MSIAFSLLTLFCFLALLIGMIRPAIVVRWGAIRTRKMVALIYGLGFVVAFVLGGVTAPKDVPPTHPAVTVAAVTDKGNKNSASKELATKNPVVKPLSTATYNKLLAQQTKKDMSYMRINHDEITGAVFYTDKTSPKYVNSEDSIYAYVATKKGETPTLRIAFQYVGANWLFVQDYLFNIDGQQYRLTPNLVKRNNNANDVWEWSDDPVDANAELILNAIAVSKKAILRFDGQQNYKDVTITSAQKEAIQHVLNLYNDLASR